MKFKFVKIILLGCFLSLPYISFANVRADCACIISANQSSCNCSPEQISNSRFRVDPGDTVTVDTFCRGNASKTKAVKYKIADHFLQCYPAAPPCLPL